MGTLPTPEPQGSGVCVRRGQVRGGGMSLVGAKVTVLGAGVAGLAVARACALRGAQVTVLEQADAIREVGAGLQISPNGARVLRALGLGAALEAASTPSQAVELRDGVDGDLVLRMGLGPGFHLIHRADLIDLLAKGAAECGVQVHFSQRVEGIDLTGARPRLTIAHHGIRDADLLIGADGLHSRLRPALNGAETPFFTHQVAWRATIPGTPGDPAVAEVHMAPGCHLVSYPLRGGALRNLVAVEERRAWAEEGWTFRDDTMGLQLAFEGFSPRVRGWLGQVQDPWLWGLFRHPVAAVWQRALPGGAVALLGDAAHPTLPFLAQGANMALEDAWVLAATLAGHATVAAGLAAYQAARVPRATRIVAAADRNAKVYHAGGLTRFALHNALRAAARLAPDAPLKRFGWLYDADVTAYRA